MHSDAEIIARVMSGESDAFGELVRRHEPLVAAICRQLVGSEHDALDAAQDTFVRAYLNLGQLKEPARFAAWLRRVAYSVCMNRLEREGRESALRVPVADIDAVQASTGQADPAGRLASRELAEAVLASIAELPERYREPIRMFYLDGSSGTDIARRLGLKAGAVRTRLSRGREMLRARLAGLEPIEAISRAKSLRGWLPLRLSDEETASMRLKYQATTARLLRGEAQITIRPMTRADIPALRRYDAQMTAAIPDINAQSPPGGWSTVPGGPWADDRELAEHFDKYQKHGGVTLLAMEDSGRIVGFADLWPTAESEPFGRSVDVECIDYFREYFLAGLETVLLSEAETVARAAGFPALDVGTNTCSGEYISLRRFGLKVFYEYDHVRCRCGPAAGARPSKTVLTPADCDLTGLIKASHWSPTDFTFRAADEPTHLAELSWPEHRAVVELWHYREGESCSLPVPQNPPNRTELYVQPAALTSSAVMMQILVECAVLAGELGAAEIELPCPSEVELEPGGLDVLDRQFAFAWLRKRL